MGYDIKQDVAKDANTERNTYFREKWENWIQQNVAAGYSQGLQEEEEPWIILGGSSCKAHPWVSSPSFLLWTAPWPLLHTPLMSVQAHAPHSAALVLPGNSGAFLLSDLVLLLHGISNCSFSFRLLPIPFGFTEESPDLLNTAHTN